MHSNNQKNKTKINFFFQLLPLFIVFLLFMFFRFANIGNRISFGWDQEQYSTQVRQLIVDHKPVLLGPRTTNDRGFFLAPYFTYLITPFFLLTGLHPYAIGIFLIFFNILFFVGSIYILSNLFSKKTALLFLLLWSINPIITRYDSVAWWPIFIPFGALVIFFLLKKISDANNLSHWIILGITSGILMNMHIQFAFIFLFVFLFIFFSRSPSFKKPRNIILFLVAFLFMFLPLFVFDIRHDFINSKLIINFLSKGIGDREPNFFAWLPVFENVIQPLVIVKNIYVTVLFYIGIVITQYHLYKNKKGFLKDFYFISLLVWIIFPFIFGKYGQRPSEYYFMFLYPFIYLTIVDFFLLYKKVILLIAISFILLGVNLQSLFFNMKTDPYSLKYKDMLIRKLSNEVKGKKFNLSYSTSLTTDYGFRYLVDYYKIPFTGDWNDPLVQIKIPADNKCKIKVNDMGVIIPSELL